MRFPLLLGFNEMRKALGLGPVGRELLLYSFQVTAQQVGACGFSHPARLQIEQQVEFPRGECVTPDSAADKLLNELTE